MPDILNWRLLSHPMNWVTVILMLLIAGIFGHMALTLFGMEPANPASRSSYTQLPAGQSPRTQPQYND